MSDLCEVVKNSGIIVYEDYILVSLEKSEKEEKSAGGIILRKEEKDEPMNGTVVMVGPGRVTDSGNTIPVKIEIGTQITFKKWAGTKLNMKSFGINDNEFMIVKASEIMIGKK